MSITALVAGKLIAEPVKRIGPSGKPYTLARMSAHDGEAGAVVSLIAFGPTGGQLAALAKGDALAVNGSAKVKTWQAQDGTTHASLSVTADTVLTAYALKKKRDALAAEVPAVADGEPAPDGRPPWNESAADAAWLSGTAAPPVPSNSEGA